MNREEIKKILPHREPMLLVDEVELVDGKSLGKCHIRGDEYFLQGHFPGNPIVPGVIQCEMLAQSACALLLDGAAEGMTDRGLLSMAGIWDFAMTVDVDDVRELLDRRHARDRVRACAPARRVLLCEGHGPRQRQGLRHGGVLVRARQGLSRA